VLSARLQFDETEGKVGIAFENSDGERIEGIDAANTTGDDVINATINTGGTYYVNVSGGQADIGYDLTVSAGDEPIAPTPTPTPSPTPPLDSGDDDGEDGSDTSTGDGGDGDGADGGDGGGSDDTGTSGGNGPGFGVAALVTALLAVALLARRRA